MPQGTAAEVRRWFDVARRHVSGPILIASLILVMEALRRTPLEVPNPSAPLLLAVVYSAFVDPRLRVGITVALAVGYTAIYFSPPNALFGYTADDGYRVLVMLLISPIMAWMTVTLRARGQALAEEGAARQLAEAERDFVRSVMDHSPIGMMVVEGERRHVALVNRSMAALVGLQPRQVSGLTLAEAFPGNAADLMRLVAEAEASAHPVVRELPFVGPAGRVAAEVAVIRLPQREDQTAGVMVIAQDLTERRRAQEELERARAEVARGERLAAMGAMVGGVAHEIRTPLAIIANHVELVSRRLERARTSHDPRALDEVPALLDEVKAAVERSNALVVEMRRFLKAEPGHAAPVDLEPPVRDALRIFEMTHTGQTMVDARLSPTPEVLVDPVHVQQIVLNLLENAAAASGPGTPIRVLLQPHAGGAELVVEDRGRGMTPDVRDRVFEPFFTTKEEGTGLGLAIVRRLVELHGGSIRCDSAPGLGTTFHVTFPARGRAVPIEAVSPPPKLAAP